MPFILFLRNNSRQKLKNRILMDCWMKVLFFTLPTQILLALIILIWPQ